jgi:hypothetical protein
MAKEPKEKVTKSQLRAQLRDALASQANAYPSAIRQLHRVSTAKMMGSGVLITMSYTGGNQAVCPVMIRDGLSEATIEAIRADLHRSFELATINMKKDMKP